jgi:hypothetical protein
MNANAKILLQACRRNGGKTKYMSMSRNQNVLHSTGGPRSLWLIGTRKMPIKVEDWDKIVHVC